MTRHFGASLTGAAVELSDGCLGCLLCGPWRHRPALGGAGAALRRRALLAEAQWFGQAVIRRAFLGGTQHVRVIEKSS